MIGGMYREFPDSDLLEELAWVSCQLHGVSRMGITVQRVRESCSGKRGTRELERKASKEVKKSS